MNRYLKFGMLGLAAIAATAFVFREPLSERLAEQITANMFVPGDSDTFDPGVAIGQPLPALRAMHAGREVTSLAGLMGTRGTVLVVNRSVDW